MNKLIANNEYQGILKGDKFECLNDVILRERDPETQEWVETDQCFTKGKIYESPHDGDLLDNQNRDHGVNGDFLTKNFKRI